MKPCLTFTNGSIQAINAFATVFARVVFAIWSNLTPGRKRGKKIFGMINNSLGDDLRLPQAWGRGSSIELKDPVLDDSVRHTGAFHTF